MTKRPEGRARRLGVADRERARQIGVEVAHHVEAVGFGYHQVGLALGEAAQQAFAVALGHLPPAQLRKALAQQVQLLHAAGSFHYLDALAE